MGISMIDDPMIEALNRFLDVNVARHKLIASNLANVDTPNYRARDLDFRAEMARHVFGSGSGGSEYGGSEYGGGAYGGLSYASFNSSFNAPLNQAFAPVSRPVHGLVERADGNDVSVEREGLLMAETQMRFNLGIQLLKDEFHGIAQAINSGGGTSS
jgi:flagellar basal-body rod protein FlgB